MKVSVITPFRNYNEKIRKCIDSVKSQKYRDFEIIVVSDKAKVNEKGVKSLVVPRADGPGAKRNAGARIATGDILFFLDSDCTVKQDSIRNLVKTFKETKADGVTGKPLAPRNGNMLGTVTGWEYEDRFNRMGETFVDVAATTCFGVLKDAFRKTNGFKDYSKNEAIGEDWDFSTRFRNRGFKIFHTNNVEVFHEHTNESIATWLKKAFLHAKYRIVHLKKYKKSVDQYSSWEMMMTSTLLLSIPTVVRMYRKKDARILLLPFFSIFRSIAWLAGAVSGLLSK